MGSVFDNASISTIQAAPDTSTIVSLRVGGSFREFFLVAGPIESNQTDRIQVDASADGTLHVTACKGSVGTCSITLLDASVNAACSRGRGRATSSADSSALKYYTSELTKFENRRAELILHSSGTQVAKFDGIIRGVSVRAHYNSRAIPETLVTLHLIGSWVS